MNELEKKAFLVGCVAGILSTLDWVEASDCQIRKVFDKWLWMVKEKLGENDDALQFTEGAFNMTLDSWSESTSPECRATAGRLKKLFNGAELN